MALLVLVAPFATPLACTLLVSFDEPDASSPFGDGSLPTDGGVFSDDGAFSDDGDTDGPCASDDANGANWDPSNPYARCCNNAAVVLTTIDNCGACGNGCPDGGSCEVAANGHYYCTCTNVDAGVDEDGFPLPTNYCESDCCVHGLCVQSDESNCADFTECAEAGCSDTASVCTVDTTVGPYCAPPGVAAVSPDAGAPKGDAAAPMDAGT